MLKKNDIFTVEIEDMNFLGFGVAKIDGMAVFVSGAATLDVASVKVIKVAKTYAIARTEKIITPSPYRVNNDCPVSASCGGCAFRSVTYDYEKSLKESFVKMSFVKQGMRDVTVMPLTSAGLSHYRNKGQYPVRRDASGKTVIGFFAAKSHRVLDCSDCKLQNPAFAPIISEIREFIDKNNISVYNEESGKGLLRHIYLYNNDHYTRSRTKLNMELRELFENLKDKDPGYYYTDVLCDEGETLQDFINQ